MSNETVEIRNGYTKGQSLLWSSRIRIQSYACNFNLQSLSRVTAQIIRTVGIDLAPISAVIRFPIQPLKIPLSYSIVFAIGLIYVVNEPINVVVV